jgi:hypothetical protein
MITQEVNITAEYWRTDTCKDLKSGLAKNNNTGPLGYGNETNCKYVNSSTLTSSYGMLVSDPITSKQTSQLDDVQLFSAGSAVRGIKHSNQLDP